MSDELVERLLDWPYQGETMAHEAADRIKQLTAERDHARDEAWAYMSALQGNLYDAFMIEAERDRLREALDGLLASVEHANFEEGWCCCGDDMLHHQNPMDCGHTPVDMGEYHASLAIKEARAALKGESHE